MGVYSGYKHKWKYVGRWEERKIGKRTWAIRFVATKNKKARGYGNVGRGSRFSWAFKNVRQRARKTGRGRYQTIMTGIKYLKKSKVMGKKRMRGKTYNNVW